MAYDIDQSFGMENAVFRRLYIIYRDLDAAIGSYSCVYRMFPVIVSVAISTVVQMGESLFYVIP